VYPVTGKLQEFPVNPEEVDSGSTIEKCIITLFVRMMGNAARAGIESIVNQEYTEFVLTKKEFTLGRDSTYAISEFAKFNLDLIHENGNEVFDQCLNNIFSKLESIEGDFEYHKNEIYSEISRVASSFSSLLDLAPFFEKICGLATKINEKEASAPEFAVIIGYFAEKKENIPVILQFIYYIFGLCNFSSCIDDCCRKVVMAVDKDPEILKATNDDGKTVGVEFIENAINRISTQFSAPEMNGEDNIPLSYAELFNVESLDLESIILLIIKIVFTQEVPGELLEQLLQVMMERVSNDNDEFTNLIACELISSFILMGIDIVPEEVQAFVAQTSQSGILVNDYSRALIGSALVLIPAYNELGQAVLSCKTEQNYAIFIEQYNSDYPDFKLIPNFCSSFVPISKNQ
jgi:hypothetical protein